MTNYAPPTGLPIYRVLTGSGDADFCQSVSDALVLGYKLYGPPTITMHGKQAIVAQAVVWPTAEAAIATPLTDEAPRPRFLATR